MVSVEVFGVQVVATKVEDPQLEPMLFIARNCIGYVVPLLKPVIVNGLVVIAGDGITQVLPLSNEYSYPVMAEYPLSVGAVKATVA